MRKRWKRASALRSGSGQRLGDERVVVDRAAVPRLRLQREVEVVERHRAVLDDDLVDLALLAAPGA